MAIIAKFLLIFFLFILVDSPYLYYNSNTYKNITHSISKKPYTSRYYSIALVYIALSLGLLLLVLPKIQKRHWVRDSLIYGGGFGIASYAVFDFTAHFMFDGWSLTTSIIDTLWGGVLCSIVTSIATIATIATTSL